MHPNKYYQHRNSLNRQWLIEIKMALVPDMPYTKAKREVSEGRWCNNNHNKDNPIYSSYKAHQVNKRLITELNTMQLGNSVNHLYYVVVSPLDSQLVKYGIKSFFNYPNIKTNPYKLIKESYQKLSHKLFIIREHQESGFSLINNHIFNNNQDNLVVDSDLNITQLKALIHNVYQGKMHVPNNIKVEPIRTKSDLKAVINYTTESLSQQPYSKHVTPKEYAKLHQFQHLTKYERFCYCWAIKNSIKGATLQHTKRSDVLRRTFGHTDLTTNDTATNGSKEKNKPNKLMRVYSAVFTKRAHTTSSSITVTTTDTKNTAQVLELWRLHPT